MPDKDQFGIYTNDQLSLIKNTFADNDTLLYTIRKVFLQFPMTEVEKGLIRSTVNDDIFNILKIRMIPDLSPTFPLSQLPSIHTTLTQDLKVKDVQEMAAQFEAKQLEVAYLEQQFTILSEIAHGIITDRANTIKLADLARLEEKTPHQQFVDMTAYLFLLGYIDPSLNFIKAIAGQKDETQEEQTKRLKRDSSQ